MSDLRFKITGSKSPFTAELYRCDGPSSSTFIASQVVEYSGISTTDRCNHTCVVFDNLVAQRNYCVDITDCVGNTYSSTYYCTPPNPITLPVIRNINLSGGLYKPAIDGVCVTCGTKELIFSPTLSGNECISVNLCGIACSTSDDCATVKVYKKCGGGSFIEIASLNNNNNTISTQMGSGDRLCYDLYSEINHPSSQTYSRSCAELSINSATPLSDVDCVTCGPQTCLDISNVCCTTTTTTSTTSTPINVYFNNINQCSLYCDTTVCAGLATSPPLQAGQSFRVTLYLRSYYTVADSLVSAVGTQSKVECNSTINRQTSVCSGLPVGGASNTCTSSFYYDVNCSNINNLCFCTCVNDNPNNNGLQHQVFSCICICAIENQVGGSYNKGTSSKITACSVSS